MPLQPLVQPLVPAFVLLAGSSRPSCCCVANVPLIPPCFGLSQLRAIYKLKPAPYRKQFKKGLLSLFPGNPRCRGVDTKQVIVLAGPCQACGVHELTEKTECNGSAPGQVAPAQAIHQLAAAGQLALAVGSRLGSAAPGKLTPTAA